ncbi:MAG: hypothetical protein DMG93_21870 [Acidobacteria bacterium]|nr:MAG: hypothetical protein DMG93_21870 [Acidobacteriota bacterium]
MLSVGFPIDAKVGVFAMGKQYYCIPVRMLAPEALMTSTRGCVSGRVAHSSLVLADWGSSTAAGFPPLFRVSFRIQTIYTARHRRRGIQCRKP